MWLYVPNTSTSSPSAPEEADSISASSWQFKALEASVWWRGKPSQSRHWFQRWSKASFIRLLCGRMPEPSTAERGVAQWTASLVASRASLTVLPASASEKKTSATSGPTPAASSSSPARGSSSSRMSVGCCLRAARNVSGETFTAWASRLREDCSRRQKSAQAMSASASSSSAWPTPATRDHKGANGADHLENGTGRRHLDQLPNFVEHIWEKSARPYLRDNVWPTPVVLNKPRSDETLERCLAVRKAKAGQNTVPLYLEDLASRLSLPVLATSPHGAPSSNDRRSLNPLFVEWLMGWPPGWTLLAWTDFACSATELSLFKQRMRSALLSLGLPREAPPVQLALFG